MQTFKPLLLGAALAAGFVWTGAAVAAQPADAINQVAATDSASTATQTITTHVRKVYLFPMLDKNHNGRLSRAEIPTDMHELRRRFLQADFDQDGQLSPQEYVMYAHHTAPMYAGVSHTRIWLFAGSGNQWPIRTP
ncbi:MAG TPA: EF-hand domain-containing protein [Oleiagrimonas sp.]|nr:EF-hand domain-containing protein [Oleiagrimonas sp.]